MADQGEAKTKTIGFLPIEKVQTLPGWDEYVDKSSKLAALRTETQKAKNSVREALKQRLDENNEIDFATEGDRIRVLRVFRKLCLLSQRAFFGVSFFLRRQRSAIAASVSPMTDPALMPQLTQMPRPPANNSRLCPLLHRRANGCLSAWLLPTQRPFRFSFRANGGRRNDCYCGGGEASWSYP